MSLNIPEVVFSFDSVKLIKNLLFTLISSIWNRNMLSVVQEQANARMHTQTHTQAHTHTHEIT